MGRRVSSVPFRVLPLDQQADYAHIVAKLRLRAAFEDLLQLLRRGSDYVEPAKAIQVLARATGPRWLVLGDMAELGDGAATQHRTVGAAARGAGLERLLATGPLSEAAVEAFGPGGQHFEHFDSLVETLRRDLPGDATVLVKGSRSARMERVVSALCPVTEVPVGGTPCC